MTGSGVGNWVTFGDALAQGLAGGVNNYLATTNQIKEQRQQQANIEAARQQQQEQFAAAQAQQQNQFDQNFAASQQQMQFNQARLTAADRNDNLRQVIAPAVSQFMAGIQNDKQRYAPTLPNGAPNPQFDPAMYQASLEREKEVNKKWRTASLTVGSGQGHDESVSDLMQFIGADPVTHTAAAPMQGPHLPAAPQVGQQSTAPVVQPDASAVTNFGSTTQQAQPAAAPAQPDTSAVTNFGDTAQQPATAQPDVHPDNAPDKHGLPSRVQEIPPSVLAQTSDADIVQHYGQAGAEYARAAKAQYAALQREQQEKVRASQVTFWTKAATNLLDDKDNPATPEQLAAASKVLAYSNMPSLTPEQSKEFASAVQLLAPQTLNAKSWAAVVATKDPATIMAAYPMYAKQAPDVVAGFDLTNLTTMVQSELDKAAADAAHSQASATKETAEATRLQALTPGEVQAQQDTHTKTAADIAATQATTAKTVQDVAGAKTDVAVKLLGQLSTFPPDMSYAQIAKAAPQLVAQVKAALGVNDAGAANLIAQGQYQYSQGVKGKELEQALTQSKIQTEGAQRGQIIASTADTQSQIAERQALLPGKVQEQGAQVQSTLANARAANANAQSTSTLLPGKVAQQGADIAHTNAQTGLTRAQVGQASASTALTWANVGKVAEDLKLERKKTDAYIQSVKGKTAVDMAQVGQITANTALTRARNPNDPLYRPELAATPGKATDPYSQLSKQADVRYKQADRALGQAKALQTQITNLGSQYKTVTGTIDQVKLQADPKYKSLVQQRDSLMQQAQGYRQAGDQMITNGLAALDKKAVKKDTNPTVTLGAGADQLKPAFGNALSNMVSAYRSQNPGGLIPYIHEGYRSPERQTKLYNQGRTTGGAVVTHARAGESLHNYGYATDIYFKDAQGREVSPNDPRAKAAWKQMGSMAPQFGLRWGGTFPDLVDMPHFEPANYSWQLAKAGKNPTSLPAQPRQQPTTIPATTNKPAAKPIAARLGPPLPKQVSKPFPYTSSLFPAIPSNKPVGTATKPATKPTMYAPQIVTPKPAVTTSTAAKPARVETFGRNAGLENALISAVTSRDNNKVNKLADQLSADGYTDEQIKRIIKKTLGGS